MPRKSHKYHYIYKITNLKNNKYYIGMHSTSDLEDEYFGSGKRVRNSIRKHGKDFHIKEILEYLPDRISLAAKEKEIVNEDLLKDHLCMNLVIGGETGGFVNIDHQKKFISAGHSAMREKLKDPLYKTYFSEKSDSAGKMKRINDLIKNGDLIRSDWTGKNHKDSTKKKIGKSNSVKQYGEKNSQFGKIWICNISEQKTISVYKNDIENYLSKGWILGSLNSGETLLSKDQVIEIKRLASLGISRKEICKKMCVSKTTVAKILRGETWKFVN